jgi:predicted nucleotidyltransferase
MRRVEAALREIVRDLADAGRSFALLGGFAVSVRTEPRTTRDVDLAVLVRDDADAEALTFALVQRGYVLGTAIEQTGAGRLATVRLEAPSKSIVDLLFASSGIEDEVIAAAEPLDVVEALSIPVPRVGHLIALKVLSRDDRERPQDRVDLHALLRVATDDELERARRAVRLIEARGFARGKDLAEELDRAIEELGPRMARA